MKSWSQPPDFNYSFKSHFSYPSSPHVNAAGPAGAAAEAASAGVGGTGAVGSGGHPPYGPRGYYSHGNGYGGLHHWRPRFGFFRRMVWFGLGVGVASWYIHHKERDQLISSSHHPTTTFQTRANPSMIDRAGLGQWQAPPTAPGMSNTARPTTDTGIKAEYPNWGWGARREARRQRREDAAAAVVEREAEEVEEANKKDLMSLKVRADDKTRQYAKEKLDMLTKALDKLREALDDDTASKERKIV